MKVFTFCLGALRTNTYFCADGDNAVVIDPGMDGEGIFEKLCEKGLKCSHILLTHGHFDHSQGVKILAEKTGAKVCIHRDDAIMLDHPGFNVSALYYRGDTSVFPRTKADVILEEGSVLEIGNLSFCVLHTPGHTPGSVCFASEAYLFCGDTVFSQGFGRYDLWGGDKAALSDSLERVAALSVDYMLCPGHGNKASLSRIREQIRGNALSLKD